MTGRPTTVFRRVQAGRLVYYRQDPDAAFWDDHWQAHAAVDSGVSSRGGSLGPLERPILRHLPREAKILEAGCGPGQHVLALRERGYDVEGIDWAPKTVATARARHPGLPIAVGDVARLSVPDGHYAGYLSFGVVEHRPEGPEDLLREAHRVLRPDGVALVSVPCFNRLRRIKARFGAYRGTAPTATFYQYAFRPEEFISLIARAGFVIVRVYGYDAYKGLVDEVPWLARLLNRHLGRYHVGALAQRALRRSEWVERALGHMLLIVGQKQGG